MAFKCVLQFFIYTNSKLMHCFFIFITYVGNRSKWPANLLWVDNFHAQPPNSNLSSHMYLILKFIGGQFQIWGANVIQVKATHCLRSVKCHIHIHPDLPTNDKSVQHHLQWAMHRYKCSCILKSKCYWDTTLYKNSCIMAITYIS